MNIKKIGTCAADVWWGWRSRALRTYAGRDAGTRMYMRRKFHKKRDDNDDWETEYAWRNKCCSDEVLGAGKYC